MNWNDLFVYSPDTGTLYWKTKPGSRSNVTVGDVAGWGRPDGYQSLMYKNKPYMTHRVIWEMFNGPIPKGYEIDHINNKKDDNRLHNLRLATRNQQMWNRKLNCDSTSGVKGVTRSSFNNGHYYWIGTVWKLRKRYTKCFPFTDLGKQQAAEWVQATREELHKRFYKHE